MTATSTNSPNSSADSGWRRDPLRDVTVAPEAGTGDRVLPLREVLVWDANSTRHLVFIVATAVAVYAWGLWGLLMYPALTILADILYYVFRIVYFDPRITVQRGYQIGAVLSDSLHSQGLDYGFNFYDGDYSKSRLQAQEDKFAHAWDQLGLRPGMRLMDVGCGCGDWLAWVRSRGVEVMGINITREQAKVCHSRDLDVINADWKDVAADEELMARLEGQFDCVTFWDTVEHYVPLHYRGRYPLSDGIYKQMFALANRLRRPDSPSGRVLISCLHIRRTLAEMGSFTERLRLVGFALLLDKMHNGCYPSANRDCLVKNGAAWYDLIERKDLTRDYYMTSVLEPTHFGRSRFKMTPTRLAFLASLLIVDPFWFARLLWYMTENWMFQFNSEDLDKSAMVHWWLTLAPREDAELSPA